MGRLSLCSAAWVRLDRRLRRQRRSQDSHSRAGQACLAARQASSMGLHISTLAPQKHRPRIWRLFACSLVGWPVRHYLTIDSAGLGSDTGRVLGVELRPGHNTGHGQQDARSSAVGASESPCDPGHERFPLSHRLPPGLEAPRAGILPTTSAQRAGAAGGALACRTPSKTRGSLLLPVVETYKRPSEGPAARLPAPSAKQRNFWSDCSSEGANQDSLAKQASATPASHWTWHANSSCFPFCTCSKTIEAKDSSSFPSRTRKRQRKLKTRNKLRCQQLQITPCALRHGGASEDRAVNARSLEEVQKRGGWKSFNSVRRSEKHACLSQIMSTIPPELLRQGPALERDLDRLWKRL